MNKVRFPFVLFTTAWVLLLVVAISCRLFNLIHFWQFGDLFTTTSAESFPVYTIWKVVHGYPMYEWPQKDWYSLSIYNWLFYAFYGWVCRICGADNTQILYVGRAVTLVFSCLGAAATIGVTRVVLWELNLKPRGFILTSGALLLWFGPGTMGGNNYTVRPDMAALALALGGLGCFLVSMRAGMPALMVSGFLFYLAWSFKQSLVWTFSGCFVYLLLSRDWKRAVIFAAFLLLPIAVTLAVFGPVYRYNIFVAPSIAPLLRDNLFFCLPRILFYAGFVLGWILYWPMLVDGASLQQAGWRNFKQLPIGTRQLVLLMLTAVLASFMNTIMLAKLGSSMNIFFEALALLGILALISGHHLFRAEAVPRPGWLLYGSVLLFIAAVLPAKNLALYKRGNMGPVITTQIYDTKTDFGRWLKTLPAPLFIRDEIFSQPWFSNRGQYPAIMTDDCFYGPAQVRGRLQEGGLPSLVRHHYFSALLVTQDDEMAMAAREAGYIQAPLPPDKTYFQSSTSEEREGPLVLWLRP